jgi:predicted hydrocarbon binding protein
MGKLFNKPKNIEEGLNEISENEPQEFKNIPEDIENYKLISRIGSGAEMLFYHSLKTILKLGDFDDFKELNKEIAKSFFEDIFEKNSNLFDYLRKHDLDFLVEYLNTILLNHKLGFIQLSISEKEDFEINLYESFFVKFVKRENKVSKEKIPEEKICVFFESLFSTLFSNIFEQDVTVEEKVCSLNEDNPKCIFSVKMS